MYVTYAVGYTTKQKALPMQALKQAPPGKMCPKISFVPYAAPKPMNSLKFQAENPESNKNLLQLI